MTAYWDPTAFETLVDLVLGRAEAHPERVAYTFLRSGETEADRLTCADLAVQAQAMGQILQSRCEVGDRALLLFPSGLDFIVAFFGCLFAGVIPTPAVPERSRPDNPAVRLAAIAGDARPAVVLSTVATRESLFDGAASWQDPVGTQWLTTEDVAPEQAQGWRPPDIDEQSLALLQYTSGSTGTPKGVMVTHRNLLQNGAMIQQAMGHSESTVQIGWLPLFHDMGLVGNMLAPMYAGGTCVLMSPLSFLQRPLRWLRAISRYGGTTSGGPNFAYDLCSSAAQREDTLDLDLSSWRVAFNGAEPIRAGTLNRFVATFEPYGFSRSALFPCYGLAEATLFVAGVAHHEEPVSIVLDGDALGRDEVREVADDDGRGVVLIPSGRAWGEEMFAIVHPDTGKRSKPGTVGEIWVRGDHIAVGYWQRPEETDAVFGARLTDTGEGPFLRTGDLGFLRNERLVVTGRIKDLIIVRGINHYPQDIELTVERIHPLLRPGCGAAFSVDGAEEERLVVAHEVSRSFKAGDADILCEAIRRAIGEEHSLAVSAICLLPSGGIPKTSSGKVRRRFVRELYRQGTIKTVHVWEAPEAVEIESDSSDAPSVEPAHRRDKTAIVDWICRELARRLHLRPDEIDTLAPFASYGLDSMRSVAIAARLGDWIGIELPVTLVWHYPTVDSLADYLAGTTEARRLPVERGAIQTREPIAVIGVACRFPGADGPEKFWDALLEGKDAITEVPPERWDANALYDPALSTEESANTHWGGFINGIEMFDPGFFGMSRDEARGTDPQHRLLLETAWQALEHAGIAPDSVKGSDTGVFVGISTSDYYKQMTGAPARGATGIATSMAANRVSYVFDLTGPSLAIDTACSSSLVAVDLACSALRSGTSGLALAGGVNVLLSPDLTVALSQAGLMAPDGRCKTFDEEANGYVRSEGCGLVLLKRLSDAIRDGDTVLACIRGSAVNTNGRGNGITAPSQAAQELVLRKAWDAAGLDPRSAGYLEAHGSGTVLGDLIEVQSLDSVFGESDAGDAPRAVGSVKTNIGHLEAAAGVAGLIKTVLSLHHACIPPHLHVRTLSSHLERYAQRWVIPREPLPWIGNDTPRRAGVSSFGFGGVNAHVVLEEAPPQSPHQSPIERSSFLLLLSARDRNALRTLAATYRDHLLRHDDEGLADVCATAAVGRTHFAHRYAIVAASRDEIIDSLARIHFGDLPATAVTGLVNRGKRTTLEFKFPNGEVDPSVCEVLCESEPVFRASWESWRNTPAFEPSRPDMASLAFQASLYTLWRSWGVDVDRHSGTGGALVAAVGSGLLDKNTALAGLVLYHPPQPVLLTTEIECNAVLLFGQTPSTGASGEKTVVMFPDPKHPTKGLLSAVAVLYTRGVSIDWVAFNQPLTRRRVSLPTYPFQRERCWLEQPKAGGV